MSVSASGVWWQDFADVQQPREYRLLTSPPERNTIMQCPNPIRCLCAAATILVFQPGLIWGQTDGKQEQVAAKWMGQTLPFAFQALDGRQINTEQYRGKVVLLDFWATWCGPCREEIPHVKEAYARFHDAGFEVVGFSFDQNREALASMVAQAGMPWPQQFETHGQPPLGIQLQIEAIPTMWLLDRSGRVRFTDARASLDEKIRKLLSEPYNGTLPNFQEPASLAGETSGRAKSKVDPFATWRRATPAELAGHAPATGLKLKGIIHSSRLQQAMLAVDGTSVTMEPGQSCHVKLDGKSVLLTCESIEEKAVSLKMGLDADAKSLTLVLKD